MSIIFGTLNFMGQPVDRQTLLALARTTQKYATDGTFVHIQDQIGMGIQPYHTHERSALDTLPVVGERGTILSFDGRIDNYIDLRRQLDLQDAHAPDTCIILKAFERWGEGCFSKLIGDWSLALWSPSERLLYLARDHAGTRSLYYERSNGNILWSTYLETFFSRTRDTELDLDFTARYLSCQPIGNFTPYKGICAVPPAHYVRFRGDLISIYGYWQPIAKTVTKYTNSAQYEDHFLLLFQQSVARRSGPGAPVIAELSGGMDSTAIVCMADHVRRSQYPGQEPLETLSFYDGAEPNWDETPFFTAVESRRGKSGIHLDVSYRLRSIKGSESTHTPQYWPGSDGFAADVDRQLHRALSGTGIRSILSGLGGDEVLGGVPTPLPELADLVVQGKLISLSRQSLQWCLSGRQPILHLLCGTVAFLRQVYFGNPGSPSRIPPWLNEQLRDRARIRPTPGVSARLRCPLPSGISQAVAWWSALESLPVHYLSDDERFEYRYPYLDRDLVEFLFSVPRGQIVEPGRRRALMRRALRDIVPVEVLERRRKAYISRGPIDLIRRECDWIETQLSNLRCAPLGIVNTVCLPKLLKSIAHGGDLTWLPQFMRLMAFELWLRSAPFKHSASTPEVAHKIRIQTPHLGRSGYSEIQTN